MTYEIYTLEALAHFMRGATTMFFLFWSVILWKYRRRNRMMRLLQFSSILLAVCYLKDMVFLLHDWKYSEYLNNMAGIIDMIYLPVIARFFLEVANPGIVTNKQMYRAMACLAAFVPIYMFFPYDEVCAAASILSYSISATTVVYMHIFVIRYRKRMFNTYSYTENIDVLSDMDVAQKTTFLSTGMDQRCHGRTSGRHCKAPWQMPCNYSFRCLLL